MLAVTVLPWQAYSHPSGPQRRLLITECVSSKPNPEVVLSGFGLEDTHSVINSLRWGPDGWLYACQGSTVTASIVRPGLDTEPLVHTMGQQIWRYHPETHRFEVFSEGGGNAFGCEID